MQNGETTLSLTYVSKSCSSSKFIMSQIYLLILFAMIKFSKKLLNLQYPNPCEPRQEISNNVVCGTSKASDQPAHMRSLIRAFASCLNIL